MNQGDAEERMMQGAPHLEKMWEGSAPNGTSNPLDTPHLEKMWEDFAPDETSDPPDTPHLEKMWEDFAPDVTGDQAISLELSSRPEPLRSNDAAGGPALPNSVFSASSVIDHNDQLGAPHLEKMWENSVPDATDQLRDCGQKEYVDQQEAIAFSGSPYPEAGTVFSMRTIDPIGEQDPATRVLSRVFSANTRI